MHAEALIKVLLVDDHAVFRETLAAKLNDESEMQVVGEAAALDTRRRLRGLRVRRRSQRISRCFACARVTATRDTARSKVTRRPPLRTANPRR